MTALDEFVAHFQYRVLQDAVQEATASYWLARARDLGWVLTGSYSTRPSTDQLAARPDIAEKITACCNKAAVSLLPDHNAAVEVLAALYPDLLHEAIEEAA